LRVLRDNNEAFGWTIHEIKGIDLIMCTHWIHMEKGKEPKHLPGRRINCNIMEAVKGKVLKLLDADIIYPIFDGEWVSPVQCVPKKGALLSWRMTRKSS